MITEDYVSFEVAKLLKENGFDVSCRVFYKDSQAGLYEFKNAPKAYKDKLFEPCFLAPSLYMAMKWLREEHNIFIDIYLPSHSEHEDTIYHGTYSFDIFNLNTKVYVYCTWGEIEFNSYKEAVEAALKYCLENLI